MRQIYAILFFLACLVTADAQHLYQFSKIEAEFNSQIATYNSMNKVANDSLFRSQFGKILSTVMLNNGDIVSNGSAFSFTQDKDANTLSLNNSFKIIPNRNLYFDIGLNATDKTGIFNFYSSQSISRDIGLRAGLVIPMGYWDGQYFDKKEALKIEKIRKTEVDKKIVAYRIVMQKEMAALLKRQSEIHFKIEQQKNYGSKDNTDYFQDLQEITNDISTLEKLLALDDKGIESLVSKDLAKIDAENNIFTGYSANWLNVSGNFTNKSLSFSNESIMDTLIQKKINKQFKYTLEISHNTAWSTKRVLSFLQIALQYKRGTFLDSPIFKQPEFTIAPITNITDQDTLTVGYKVLNKNKYIGDYNNLNDSQYNATLSAYAACFMFYQKTLGLSMRASFNFPSGEVLYNYPQNYTVLAGIIFRNISQTDFSKANISLQAGVENLPYKLQVWDRFLVKVSVGIPFNLFSKAKNDKI